MELIPNKEMAEETLAELRQKYVTSRTRDTLHLSHCIYCLTKSFYDLTDPLPPTNQEVMLFSLGFGLEKVLLKEESSHGEIEADGLILTPDFVSLQGRVAELKTTRMSSKLKNGIPDTWVEQILGYCYATDTLEYELVILFMMGNYSPPFPEVQAFRVVVTKNEVLENWANVVTRRMILEEALKTKVPPPAQTFARDWECKGCRYRLKCGLV